jgi:hypothetical protein
MPVPFSYLFLALGIKGRLGTQLPVGGLLEVVQHSFLSKQRHTQALF